MITQIKRGVWGRLRGFTLIEIMVVLTIIAILLTMLIPPAQTLIEGWIYDAERDHMDQLAKEISASFEQASDVNNIAVVAADTTGETITGFDDPTALDANLYTQKVTISSTAYWLAKYEAIRGGQYTLGTAYTPGSASDVYTIGANYYGIRRFLLVGPASETTQRYLLISLISPLNRGILFPNIATLFNDIWNGQWDTSISSLAPANWNGANGLTASGPGSYAQWNEKTSAGRTNAARLIVRRIVQRKHTLIVTNNHPNDTLWVDIGFQPNAIVAAPASGVTQSTSVSAFAYGIPEGRQIVARRGTSAATAVEVQRFFISDNAALMVQATSP